MSSFRIVPEEKRETESAEEKPAEVAEPKAVKRRQLWKPRKSRSHQSQKQQTKKQIDFGKKWRHLANASGAWSRSLRKCTCTKYSMRAFEEDGGRKMKIRLSTWVGMSLKCRGTGNQGNDGISWAGGKVALCTQVSRKHKMPKTVLQPKIVGNPPMPWNHKANNIEVRNPGKYHLTRKRKMKKKMKGYTGFGENWCKASVVRKATFCSRSLWCYFPKCMECGTKDWTCGFG